MRLRLRRVDDGLSFDEVGAGPFGVLGGAHAVAGAGERQDIRIDAVLALVGDEAGVLPQLPNLLLEPQQPFDDPRFAQPLDQSFLRCR